MSLQDTGGRDSAHLLLPSMAHSQLDEIGSNLGELEDDQNLPFTNGGIPSSIFLSSMEGFHLRTIKIFE
jgi:hypothetical protein